VRDSLGGTRKQNRLLKARERGDVRSVATAYSVAEPPQPTRACAGTDILCVCELLCCACCCGAAALVCILILRCGAPHPRRYRIHNEVLGEAELALLKERTPQPLLAHPFQAALHLTLCKHTPSPPPHPLM
jgi:hypothetical protein